MARQSVTIRPRGGAGNDLLRPFAGLLYTRGLNEALVTTDTKTPVRNLARAISEALITADLETKVVTTPAVKRQVGIHIYGDTLDGTGIPPYSNIMSASRGFTDSGGNTFKSLDSAGWPTVDFTCNLANNAVVQSWQAGTYKCGFTSKNSGAETITAQGSCTVSNISHGTSTTFDLVVTSGGGYGFNVSGTTGGVTNVFAYLPGRTAASPTFSSEATTIFSKFSHLRFMGWSNTNFNGAKMTSTIRNTLSNYKAYKGVTDIPVTFTGGLSAGATGGTLSTPWAYPTTSYWVQFSSNEYKQVDLTNGSATATFPVALSNSNSASGAKTGFESNTQENALQMCLAAGTDCYLNMPTWEDGTNGMAGSYSLDVATYAAANTTPGGTKVYVEKGNELWNGVGYGTQVWDNLVYPSTGLTEAQALGESVYRMALQWQSAYGARFGTDCRMVMAWQAGGNGFSVFHDALAYINTTYGAPGQWIHALSIAPYQTRNNEWIPGDLHNHVGDGSITAITKASSAVITSNSSSSSNPFAVGNTVTIQGVGGMTAINGAATVTAIGGTSGSWSITVNVNSTGFGTYTSGGTITADVATIESQLTTNGNYIAWLTYSENIAITAMHYGMEYLTYEGGWEVSGESSVNVGTAITDSGMQTVATNYLQHILDNGCNRFTWLSGDVNSENGGGNIAPQYALTASYTNLAAGTVPRAQAMVAFNTNGFTPTRNVVSGSGSVVQGTNLADMGITGFPSTFPGNNNTLQGDSFNRGPYYGAGARIGWIVNCTAAGVYSLVVNCTGSGTTDVEVGNTTGAVATIPYTGVSLASGNNTVGNVTLVKGINYVLLGQNASHSGCTINTLTFN